MMRIETSQGEVVIDIPEQFKKVGIKLSGGLDSALLAYLLVLYKKNIRDIEIVPITVINAIKPHQHIFAKRVILFLEKELNVKFYEHQVKPELVDPSVYGEEQSNYIKILRKKNIIDTHFAGITENPDEVLDETGEWQNDPVRDKSMGVKPVIEGNSYVPFANINKRAIAELYDRYGLTDKLFSITRSCEHRKVHFTEPHCGECWWCLERKWGFGRLD